MKFQKELSVINQIKDNGLEQVAKDLNLKISKNINHSNHTLLKYSQTNSPMSSQSVMESRGIIFNNETLEVVSLPFIKFPTYGKHHKISPEEMKDFVAFSKEDGTMIQLWYDELSKEFVVSTTGQVRANKAFNDYSEEFKPFDYDSFESLFWEVAHEKGLNYKALREGYTYVFELKTEKNRVVNHYKERELTLLMVRELTNFEEVDLFQASKELEIPIPKMRTFKTIEDCFKSLENVKKGDDNFEGYVLWNKKTKERFKIKSNTYIILHQFNGENPDGINQKGFSKERLIKVLLDGEQEEITNVFPSLKDDLETLRIKLDEVLKPFKEAFDRLVRIEDNKEFFMSLQEVAKYKKSNKIFMSIVTYGRKQFLNGEIPNYYDCLKTLDIKKAFKAIS